MYIDVNYIGRLGNNLYQYAFTNLLIKALNESKKTKYFDLKNIPKTAQLDLLVDKNFHISDSINYESNVLPRDISNRLHITDRGENDGKILSMDELISLPYGLRTTIYIDGYFQHKSYYEGKRDLLKKMFNRPKYNTRDTAVHIRLTDYKNVGGENWSLPESFYVESIKCANPTNLNIFTDEPEHRIVQNLKAQGANIICGDPVSDLMFIAEHEKIIISRSSYSWWAAILSNAKEIYYPNPSSGWWSDKSYPHKNVAIQDSNFIFVDC